MRPERIRGECLGWNISTVQTRPYTSVVSPSLAACVGLVLDLDTVSCDVLTSKAEPGTIPCFFMQRAGSGAEHLLVAGRLKWICLKTAFSAARVDLGQAIRLITWNIEVDMGSNRRVDTLLLLAGAGSYRASYAIIQCPGF